MIVIISANGVWQAPVVAGRLASMHNIDLTSQQLVKVHQDGIYPDAAKDGVLHKMAAVQTIDSPSPTADPEQDRPPSAVSVSSREDNDCEGKNELQGFSHGFNIHEE